jgi:hypothetical protein
MTQSSLVNVDQVLKRWGVEPNLQLYCTCKAHYNWEFMIGYGSYGLHDVCGVVAALQEADELAMNICRDRQESQQMSRGDHHVHREIL